MDYYELEDGKKVYPIFKIEHNNKNYLIFSEKSENVTNEDILVAEESGNELLPVSDKIVEELTEKYKDLINK